MEEDVAKEKVDGVQIGRARCVRRGVRRASPSMRQQSEMENWALSHIMIAYGTRLSPSSLLSAFFEFAISITLNL
jgi:hypothetical protein